MGEMVRRRRRRCLITREEPWKSPARWRHARVESDSSDWMRRAATTENSSDEYADFWKPTRAEHSSEKTSADSAIVHQRRTMDHIEIQEEIQPAPGTTRRTRRPSSVTVLGAPATRGSCSPKAVTVLATIDHLRLVKAAEVGAMPADGAAEAAMETAAAAVGEEVNAGDEATTGSAMTTATPAMAGAALPPGSTNSSRCLARAVWAWCGVRVSVARAGRLRSS